MPSIVSFAAAASRAGATRLPAEPSEDAAHALRFVETVDVEALLAAAPESDAACIVLGDEPEAGLAIVRRLRAAAPELAIVAIDAPSADVALSAASAGAYETTPRGEDPRLVLLALRRAAECTADHRELRSLRAQQSGGASAGPLTLLSGPLGDARSVPQLRELEREAIRHALAATGGRVGQAAKMLGMGRATLYRRLATFDVVRNS
jgi:DNA-binding NtrC family response regulator